MSDKHGGNATGTVTHAGAVRPRTSAQRSPRGRYAFIPARLGHNTTNDAVAEAIIKAQEYYFSGDLTKWRQSIYYQALAVSQLRKSLDASDTTLMTVAMLTLYEDVARFDELSWYPHQHAIVSILQARPESWPTSDMATAVLYAFWGPSFGFSCFEGTPSPFDEKKWLSLDPVWQTCAASQALSKLRKLAHQLLIQTPRLVAMLWDINGRSNRSVDSAELERLSTLAQCLYDRVDAESEGVLLHNVAVVRSPDRAGKALVAYVFEFHSIDEMETAVLYWIARIHINRLCRSILELAAVDEKPYPNQGDTAKTMQSSLPSMLAGLTHEQLQAEQTRLATNVLMS
ncbi:uncharacterized protein LTR77_009054 [Saxophila tyrrhenica]|uniref:Uncharacterized protein n=1 Tax=Saxophila tyrrhenica TaxID=1690608 RepID=A0AAV9P0C0_9PEZI|nr:hypothetical protein LTR77_009054 [Saxophila tyrrhenica]